MRTSSSSLSSFFHSIGINAVRSRRVCPATKRQASSSAGPVKEWESKLEIETEGKQVTQGAHAVHSLTVPYPFASRAITKVSGPSIISASPKYIPPAPPKSIYSGVMPAINSSMRAELDPTNRFTPFFTRNSPSLIPSGSVLIVETWSSPAQTSFTSFSGVLMAVRRRGLATSFVLRNIVLKLGVEVRFNLYSPLLKNIRVVKRADASKLDRQGGLRRTRRAKLYYLRDSRKLANIGNIIKAQRQEQEKALAAAAVDAKKRPSQRR